jgi:putative transposase
MDYAHEGHNVHLVVYHIIWCPKRRRKVLVGPIRTRLEQIVREVAAEHDWTVIELAIQPDHVHLVIRATPRTLPSVIPRLIKGVARAICATPFRSSRGCPRCGRGVAFSARRAR